MAASTKDKRDVHADITAKLIAAIEANPGRFTMPWQSTDKQPLWMPTNALTKKRYNGINVIALWAQSHAAGYQAPIWGTYRQWEEKGCQVRKGEKAAHVVFYKELLVQPDPKDETDDGKRHLARGSCVFNASQVDGFEMPAQPTPLPPIERLAAADAFFANVGMTVNVGGSQAYYQPSTDQIQMPSEHIVTGTATMTRSESWYSVLSHEHIHATGSENRLNRHFGKRFGDDAYAAEELVASIGEAFLCAEFGIVSDEPRPDHAQYAAMWLKILKGDAKAIFTAAAAASKAVAYLKGFQPQTLADPEPDQD